MFDEQPYICRWLPTEPILFELANDITFTGLSVKKIEIENEGHLQFAICPENGGLDDYLVRVVRLASGNAGFYAIDRNDIVKAFESTLGRRLVNEHEEVFESLYRQQNPPPKADFPLHDAPP